MSAARRASCHCGAIEVKVSGPIEVVLECNCSICTKKGFVHWIVARDRVDLVRGADKSTCYQFGTHLAQHLFCRVCGISPYYIPRSHPDKYSVNLRCVDGVDLAELSPMPFDGQNWEASIATLEEPGAGDPDAA